MVYFLFLISLLAHCRWEEEEEEVEEMEEEKKKEEQEEEEEDISHSHQVTVLDLPWIIL